MQSFVYPFSFMEVQPQPIRGEIELFEPHHYGDDVDESMAYREGKLRLENSPDLDLVLYHNISTSTFTYLWDAPFDVNLFSIVGIDPQTVSFDQKITLPGQLCLGARRTALIRTAFDQLFYSPPFELLFDGLQQGDFAVFPIAREGLKYQIAEAIFQNHGIYCDEIVLDAHHVFDSSVPMYNRKVEMTIFKDKDLDREQKENIRVTFLADSIASGAVIREVIQRIKERFVNLERVEIMAPLATIRGLSRIALTEIAHDVKLRFHVFETLLNALPPDYYYSAHFSDPRFHIDPPQEAAYREWWGQDAKGNWIADTACAGYGWSEVFYSPRKQVEMINNQLLMRHNLTIADIVRRNIKFLS
ncbi:MAG TPA: hypothetical protein PKD55_00695 [Bellilinea sp.]|nr:hypothetical protein [Bellilinea sp.]